LRGDAAGCRLLVVGVMVYTCSPMTWRPWSSLSDGLATLLRPLRRLGDPGQACPTAWRPCSGLSDGLATLVRPVRRRVDAFGVVRLRLRHDGLLSGWATSTRTALVDRRQSSSCYVAVGRCSMPHDLCCSTNTERVTLVPSNARQPAKHVLESVTKSTTIAHCIVTSLFTSVTPAQKRSSATAEGPRHALCQLKSCQLLHSCTKITFERLAVRNDLQGDSRSSDRIASIRRVR